MLENIPDLYPYLSQLYTICVCFWAKDTHPELRLVKIPSASKQFRNRPNSSPVYAVLLKKAGHFRKKPGIFGKYPVSPPKILGLKNILGIPSIFFKSQACFNTHSNTYI
jgi:hypothetical protein